MVNENEELMDAVLNKDLKMVNFWITNGAAINASNSYGNTALIAATKNHYLEMVKLLLANNAIINVRNQAGDTPLMLTVRNNYSEIVSIIGEIKRLNKENLLNISTTINNITSILTKAENWNDSKVMESEIIKIIANYEFYLNGKLKSSSSKLKTSLKKEFINSLKFEEGYSLLDLAILNNLQKVVSYLMNNWLVDIDFKHYSTTFNTKNRTYLLFLKENVFNKNENDVNKKDIEF